MRRRNSPHFLYSFYYFFSRFYNAIGRINSTHLPPDMLDFVVIRSQGSRAGAAECVLSLADLAAVSKSVTNGRNFVNTCDYSEFGIGKKLDYTRDSFVMTGHSEILLVGFLAGTLMSDSAGKTDLLAKSLSQNCARFHIKELRLEG